mgnify:CR=1 FL=1
MLARPVQSVPMPTQYYTATSLDGFIATEDDSLDWLFPLGDVNDTSYPAFIAEVGALAMGASTPFTASGGCTRASNRPRTRAQVSWLTRSMPVGAACSSRAAISLLLIGVATANLGFIAASACSALHHVSAATAIQRLLSTIPASPLIPATALLSNPVSSDPSTGPCLIEANTIASLRQVIDFSGDSTGNFSGVSIQDARQEVIAAGIVINGAVRDGRVVDVSRAFPTLRDLCDQDSYEGFVAAIEARHVARDLRPGKAAIAIAV